jgi:hypothetical protein
VPSAATLNWISAGAWIGAERSCEVTFTSIEDSSKTVQSPADHLLTFPDSTRWDVVARCKDKLARLAIADRGKGGFLFGAIGAE